MSEPRAALFVRIPASQARQLDSRAHALGRTKQDLVTGLLEAALVPARATRIKVGPDGEHGAKDGPDDVLTLPELAGLLKLEEEAVMGRVHAGELPGRRFGDQWRFSRHAVLVWLDGSDTPERTPPGFGSSPRAGGPAAESGRER